MGQHDRDAAGATGFDTGGLVDNFVDCFLIIAHFFSLVGDPAGSGVDLASLFYFPRVPLWGGSDLAAAAVETLACLAVLLVPALGVDAPV
eukprot:CAMPEP_0185578832 /NCGR_PEP_ID=MMETSP0434-20130131/13168_1 /TAXON_ID=626734 ORGANISM="Favella taraikaensis, Strain Fe Narragansett Bay" /NCGR_SAMPLE_ID=MMETSP0434 /ASSEMBLY_ACC=CAM_ASM_000379 /LENGTH=89 /DNA_ID=CAMNT_0028196715 /DNA_START=752 /DNA_END=1019 /DNA_ORIENTATION=-